MRRFMFMSFVLCRLGTRSNGDALLGDQRGDFAMMDAAFVKLTALAIVLVSCVVMVQPY
ncbi:hypothetical protein D3C87_1915500 [compost metagenome]